jgi:hypothetical protein
MSEPTIDPYQWLHDVGELSWDDVNAIAAVLHAGGFAIATVDPQSDPDILENDLRELDGAKPAEMARRLVERGWRHE